MAKEPSVTTSVTQYSIARVRTDQRFATMFAHARATNGDSTHRTKRTSRRRGVLRPARSVKPTEPTAPATTAIRAPARSRSRNPPSGLPRFALEVMSPGPFMLIDPPWCLMVRAYFAPSVPNVTNIDPHDPSIAHRHGDDVQVFPAGLRKSSRHLANGERRAVDGLAVESDFQD